jgi:hypothetical protein
LKVYLLPNTAVKIQSRSSYLIEKKSEMFQIKLANFLVRKTSWICNHKSSSDPTITLQRAAKLNSIKCKALEWLPQTLKIIFSFSYGGNCAMGKFDVFCKFSELNLYKNHYNINSPAIFLSLFFSLTTPKSATNIIDFEQASCSAGITRITRIT